MYEETIQYSNLFESLYSQNFSIHEIKLFEIIAAGCTKSDLLLVEKKNNKKLKFSTQELAKLLNTSSSVISNNIENIALRIMNKTIYLREMSSDGSVEFERLKIIAFTKYQNGVFEICLHYSVIPYLIKINEDFSKYNLSILLSMKSSYAIKFYKMLYQYKNIGTKLFNIEQFKHQFGIQEKYYSYTNFKNRVLESSLKEINKKTDLEISYTAIKFGRKNEEIEFLIKLKKDFKNNNKYKTDIQDILGILERSMRRK